MNLKKEEGITIVALVIVVVLMIILVGAAVNYGTDSINKANLEDIKTDMISIKTRAKIIVDHYNIKDIENLIGSAITDEEAQKLGITNSEQIRKWSTADLNAQGLNTIEGDKYVVEYSLENPNECEVYYLEGYEGKYSLTELKDL